MNATMTRAPRRTKRGYSQSRTELTIADRKNLAEDKFAGRHLSFWTLGDFELLHAVDDNELEPSVTFAEIFEVEVRSVGQRFAWLRRQGLLEYKEDEGTHLRLWRLSRRGRALIENHGELVETVQAIAKESRRRESVGWVANREWRRTI